MLGIGLSVASVLVGSFFAQAPAASPSALPAIRQIEVQFRAQIIRERRLADDRESKLIADAASTRRALEQKLQEASAQGAGVAVLLAQLAEAEQREADLLKSVMRRDPVSELMLASLADELRALGAGASPPLVSALERFASGDRLGAWPTIESLLRTGPARNSRLTARLRAIMRTFGEVDAAEVAVWWRAAVAADSTNAAALVALAQSEQDLGNAEASLAALDRASTAARTPAERQAVALQRLPAGFALGDPARLVPLIDQALDATRALNSPEDPSAPRRWVEAQLLSWRSTASLATGNVDRARADAREAIAILRKLRAADHTSVGIADALGSGLVNLARLEAAHQGFDEARRLYVESVAVTRERLRGSTTGGAMIQQGLAFVLGELCGLDVYQQNFGTASAVCAESLELLAATPQSAQRDFNMAQGTTYLAQVLLNRGQAVAAMEQFEASAAIWARLVSDYPPQAANLRGYAFALRYLAEHNSSVCWSDIVTLLQRLKPLQASTASDDQFLAYAQARGTAQSQCKTRLR